MINFPRLNKHIVTVLKEHLAAPVKPLPVRMDRPQSATTTWLLSWQKQASWTISTSPANWVTWMLILVHQLKPWGEFYFQHPCQMPSTPALLLCRAEWNFKRRKIELVSYGNNMKRRSNEDGLLLPIQTTYGANWMKIKYVYIHLYVLPPVHNTCLSFVKI